MGPPAHRRTCPCHLCLTHPMCPPTFGQHCPSLVRTAERPGIPAPIPRGSESERMLKVNKSPEDHAQDCTTYKGSGEILGPGKRA